MQPFQSFVFWWELTKYLKIRNQQEEFDKWNNNRQQALSHSPHVRSPLVARYQYVIMVFMNHSSLTAHHFKNIVSIQVPTIKMCEQESKRFGIEPDLQNGERLFEGVNS